MTGIIVFPYSHTVGYRTAPSFSALEHYGILAISEESLESKDQQHKDWYKFTGSWGKRDEFQNSFSLAQEIVH
jgi:hypothetical protein